jgi:PhzF family phenazine biosynthesis protein
MNQHILDRGIWIVDAFTPTAFRGNAAAVCIMDNGFADDYALQLTATQMDLSETAFVVPTGGSNYQLRWFTPDTEVNLCGHATLAATHVLHQAGMLKDGQQVTYDTRSGDLTAKVNGKMIEMDFPALPGRPAKMPAALSALGVEIINCQRNEENLLVEVKDFDTLLSITPNFKKLKSMDALGVIVTTNQGVPTEFDFASRYFAPGIGINEDPVTGSAHCFLAPYWAEKTGKQQFHALQASKGHGILDVTLKGDRVILAGQAITTLKGHVNTATIKKTVQTKG